MSKYKVTLQDLKPIIAREDLPALLNKIGAERICEIGVRYGEFFTVLLTADVKQAAAVDLWTETGVISQNDILCSQTHLDEQHNGMIKRAEVDTRIQVIKDFSINAAKQFPDNHFDMVYIDADHTENAVQADIAAWYPKVRSGGILAGHDYSPAMPVVKGTVLKFGVIEAVDKFVAAHNLSLHVDKNQSWFIPKP